MEKTLNYKITTDTVDLIKMNGKSSYSYKFKIQGPPGAFFYRDQIKLKCLKLDTGDAPSRGKPGKITKDRTTKVTGGKEAVIDYVPEARTFPGEYQLEVTFREKGRNGKELRKLNAKFKVVDTTPIAIYDIKGKKDYNFDLSNSGNSWKTPVKLKVEGPRNQEIELDYTFAGDPVTSFPLSIKDSRIAGKFDKKVIKLTGVVTNDEVVYSPGESPTSGKVVVTASSKKTRDKAQFTFHFKDIDCEVYYNGRPISNEQTLAVELKHSLGSAYIDKDDGYKYTTTQKSKFTFIGARHSYVFIDMKWNGYDCGHKHDLASRNKLATGYFAGFKQVGSYWEPGGNLTQTDGTVNYRNIDYLTYGLSGKITVDVAFILPKPISVNGPTGNVVKKVRFYLRVGYWGLTKLEAGENDNIKLVGHTDIHPDNHYGTQKLIDAIKAIAKAYGEACDEGKFDIEGNRPEGEDKMLHVNDMSLKYGGRYDWNYEKRGEVTVATNPFKPGHQEHMFGEEVDISIEASKMNHKQKAWLNENYKKYDFIVRRDEGNHFHFSIAPER